MLIAQAARMHISQAVRMLIAQCIASRATCHAGGLTERTDT